MGAVTARAAADRAEGRSDERGAAAEPSTLPPTGPTPPGPVLPAGSAPAGSAPAGSAPAGAAPAGAAPDGRVPPGTPAPWPVPPGGGEGEPRQRLHPLSPVLHGAKSLVVVIAGAVLVDAVPGGLRLVRRHGGGAGDRRPPCCRWSVGYNTGYHVVGRELRVYEGLLWRRTRAIPLERLQAVEVVRPLPARSRPGRAAPGGGRRRQDRGATGVPRGGQRGSAARASAGAGRAGGAAARARRRGGPRCDGATGGRAGPATARGTQPEPADQPTAHPAGVPAPVRCGLRRGAVPHRRFVVVRRRWRAP